MTKKLSATEAIHRVMEVDDLIGLVDNRGDDITVGPATPISFFLRYAPFTLREESRKLTWSEIEGAICDWLGNSRAVGLKTVKTNPGFGDAQ